MRMPSFSTIVRTFYAFSNATSTITPATRYRSLSPFARATVSKSMPTIPLIGSLFSTKNQQKMEYPVQKTDDEWQAVLSKGQSGSPGPCYPRNLH